MNKLEKVEVEYKSFKGWQTSIANCRSFDALPENAKIYVKFIEEFLQVPGIILIFCFVFKYLFGLILDFYHFSTLYWCRQRP
jgi:hypothetical protein